MSENIKIGTKENLDTLLLNNKLVIIDFWAPWCGPCKAISPLLDEVVTDLNGKVTLIKVNVDEHKDLAERFHITAIPTLGFFKDGINQENHTGMLSKKSLLTKINNILN